VEKTAELLKAVAQNDVGGCFEAWRARVERRVAADGNYFEGGSDVPAIMFNYFCIFNFIILYNDQQMHN